MGQQVGGHECSIAVAAYCYTVAVAHAHFSQFIDSSFSIQLQLLNKIIIGLFILIQGYDRHFCIVENGITLCYIKNG